MTLQSSCPSCRSPIPAGAIACPKCGTGIATSLIDAKLAATANMPAHETPTIQYKTPSPSGTAAEAHGSTGGIITQSKMMEALRAATIGDYEIIAELGRGGMATVYLAHDISLDRKVAIKVMSPALLDGPGAIERFKREARTAGALSHPHIIPIHAVRESGDLLYFVMKFVEGRPLDSVIKERGALPIPMVVQILSEVAGALAYAHRKGVVHRDVKPANIMLDDEGWAVVTDFGIAKVAEKQALTMTGATVGTPAYMSPEQCIAKDVTGRSDQYSLGIVGYELLTGRVPFSADSLMGMFMAHMSDTASPLLEGRPDCPPRLAEIIDRMIAKEPAERWPTLDDMIPALAAMMKPEMREGTRSSMVALARVSDGRPRADDFARPLSPTPRSSVKKGAAGAAIVAPTLAEHPRRRVPRWAWVAAAVALIGVGVGAWLATHRGVSPTTAPSDAATSATPVNVARVALAPDQSTITIGASAPLTISLRDSMDRAVTGRAVQWTSANPQVATVDANGVVTGHSAGNTRVTAESEGHSAAATIAVTDKAMVAKAVTISPRDSSISVGARVALLANVTGAGGVSLIGIPVQWKSSSPAVAAVDPGSGVVTALKPGTATISAVTQDGPKSSTRLTVMPAALQTVAAAGTPASTARDTAKPAAPIATPAGSARADSASEALAGAPTFTEISAGGSTTCGALTNDAGVVCWGAASQTGAKLEGVLFSKLSAGGGHICGLTPAGEASCWGANSQGQLGDGTTTDRDKPTAVKASQRFTEISVGAGHTCALSADGSAFCWGGNKYGQLGDGSRSNRNKPVLVRSTAGNQGFQSLAAGGSHTCGVTRANKAFCWGDGFSGQVGNAMQDFAQEPFAVKTDLSFRSVVAGDRHTCGLTTSGRVYCWGENKQGQLGDETKDDRNVPDSVATDKVFRAVGAGGQHTCGISTARQLLCWGNNVDGRLGDGTRSTRMVPAVAANGQTFSLMSAGTGHTCALTMNGQAMCWGANARGQLGGGSTSPYSATPVVVKVKGS